MRGGREERDEKIKARDRRGGKIRMEGRKRKGSTGSKQKKDRRVIKVRIREREGK